MEGNETVTLISTSSLASLTHPALSFDMCLIIRHQEAMAATDIMRPNIKETEVVLALPLDSSKRPVLRRVNILMHICPSIIMASRLAFLDSSTTSSYYWHFSQVPHPRRFPTGGKQRKCRLIEMERQYSSGCIPRLCIQGRTMLSCNPNCFSPQWSLWRTSLHLASVS